MLASSAPFLAVIDADLQHDPALLPAMLAKLQAGAADLVVASRYVKGGSLGDWTPGRERASRLATRVAQRILPNALSDPMSGYFMIRRELVDDNARALSAIGFKILLDIVLTCGPAIQIFEIPYTFAPRQNGVSKLTARVAWDFLLLLADKTIGRLVPVQFVAFGAVGAAGVVIHLLAMLGLLWGMGASFVPSQGVATAATIVFNFALNNALTFTDRCLSGARWWSGLASFAAICSFGAFANVGVAAHLFEHRTSWPLAALAGVAVSAVWNYGMSARYTWGSGR
jgi:dolichol-phosphate mannosyltransferase